MDLPAAQPGIADVSFPRSCKKRQVLPGCQNRRSPTVQMRQEAAATMSTTQGPWKLLTRNCGIAKLRPATRHAGQTWIIPLNPDMDRNSQQGTITEENG